MCNAELSQDRGINKVWGFAVAWMAYTENLGLLSTTDFRKSLLGNLKRIGILGFSKQRSPEDADGIQGWVLGLDGAHFGKYAGARSFVTTGYLM